MTDPARYRAAPFRAVKGRSGNRVVLQLASGERRAIPEGAFAVLDRLRGFQTLHEHAQAAALRMGNERGRDSHLLATLEDLKKQSLVVSEEEFLRLAGSKDPPGRPVQTIGIPARESSALIERCVRSYAAHARPFGRQMRFAVAGPEAREVTGERVEWLDRKRVEAAIGDLGRAGIESAVARFALTGAAEGLPPGIARTTGSNRNVLLLATQGEAFLSVDDDTLCGLLHAPAPKPGLALLSRGTPFDMWFETNLPDPVEAPEVDLMAEIGRALGPALAIVKDRAVSLAPGEFEHRTMEKLCGGATTRVLQIGLRGDAATDSPAGWMTNRGVSREPLIASESEYRRVIGSRRIQTASAVTAVSDTTQLMGYFLAMDNRSILPPFPPLGRDQDGVFVLWLRAAEPLSFTAFLPYAIAHEPDEPRAFEPDAILRGTRGMLLNDALRFSVAGLEKAGPRDSVAARLQWLGAETIAIADLAPPDFRQLLVERRMAGFSHAIAFYETSLAAHGSRPAWWARDMQALIRACERAMTGPDILRLVETGAERPVEDEITVLRTYVRWCGKLLREWPAISAAVCPSLRPLARL